MLFTKAHSTFYPNSILFTFNNMLEWIFAIIDLSFRVLIFKNFASNTYIPTFQYNLTKSNAIQ